MEPQHKTPSRWTIKDVLEWTAAYFKKRGITTARLDAEVLLAFCLSADRLFLYLNLERPLLTAERVRYRELVRRRAMREPVSLIIGKKEFWSLPFRVVPGVLIPRPDTEILVEAVVQEIRSIPEPRVLEIGTGSGAVSVAIAKENPTAEILATDVNLLALETASLNAEECGVSGSIDFLCTDLFLAISQRELFDVICSNPPYIPHDTIPTLDPEINFEPILALDGGPDGLDVIRHIAVHARHFLKDRGALILEMDPEQENQARRIFTNLTGLAEIRVFPDLSGKARVIKGKLFK
ncbi:MAG: peptide chain release factor N(5)-glutamine methyltransferase [Desulfomonile tiedjei]|uniref:Release factor glutamine methyltransferase n=1 Tax=Desulfomonile tiedjei TaxID=2358 RepID=A0A9D6V3R3_9BACT|nr:peptide chain release factor N(5)-glutamine methyltransferase [Desulfomonile tiedjei]